MGFHTLRDRIIKEIGIGVRLRVAAVWYLLAVMIQTRKHSLTDASELSGIGKASFCRFLKNNKDVSGNTSENLSRKEAEKFSAILKMTLSLPRKIFILTDSTVQERSSLKSEKVQRFNHGHGFVIGHQRTAILLIFNGIIIPFGPIPFYSRKYCRQNGIVYGTEHDKVAELINRLNSKDYMVSFGNSGVVVLTDSGYDDKTIRNAVMKQWFGQFFNNIFSYSIQRFNLILLQTTYKFRRSQQPCKT